MSGEKEFGYHEDGLPGPEEISDEERRTEERRGAHRGRFLAPENIPNWFSDLGIEREAGEEDPEKEETIEDFNALPLRIRREIIKQVETEMKLKPGMDAFGRARHLIKKNAELMKQREAGKKQPRF